MSVARIVAMLAARKRAEYLGQSSGSESATTAVLPAAARAGDFMALTFYSGATISGGSGTAWATTTFGNTRIASRVIEPGDLTNTINFNRNTPYICYAWRGPVRLSASVSSNTVPGTVPGVTPSANAIGLYGSGSGDTSSLYWQAGAGWQHASTQPTSGLGYGTAELSNIEAYVPGTGFLVLTDAGAGEARVFELLAY